MISHGDPEKILFGVKNAPSTCFEKVVVVANSKEGQCALHFIEGVRVYQTVTFEVAEDWEGKQEALTDASCFEEALPKLAEGLEEKLKRALGHNIMDCAVGQEAEEMGGFNVVWAEVTGEGEKTYDATEVRINGEEAIVYLRSSEHMGGSYKASLTDVRAVSEEEAQAHAEAWKRSKERKNKMYRKEDDARQWLERYQPPLQ